MARIKNVKKRFLYLWYSVKTYTVITGGTMPITNYAGLEFFSTAVLPEKYSAEEDKVWGVYRIQQTSSKLPANVFKIHVVMLGVCWTFAGSCKHPISLKLDLDSSRIRGCTVAHFDAIRVCQKLPLLLHPRWTPFLSRSLLTVLL